MAATDRDTSACGALRLTLVQAVSPEVASCGHDRGALPPITFDSLEPEPLARWWAERVDAEITVDMDGFFLIVAGGSLPAQLAFQKVEDPTPGKNKVHLDVHTNGVLNAEVDRWVEAGATTSTSATPATSCGSRSRTPTATNSASPAADGRTTHRAARRHQSLPNHRAIRVLPNSDFWALSSIEGPSRKPNGA